MLWPYIASVRPWPNGETSCQKYLLRAPVSPMFHSFSPRGTLLPEAKYISAVKQFFFSARKSVSRMAKLRNLGETCVPSKCLWQHVSSFCQSVRVLYKTCSHPLDQSKVKPKPNVIRPHVFPAFQAGLIYLLRILIGSQDRLGPLSWSAELLLCLAFCAIKSKVALLEVETNFLAFFHRDLSHNKVFQLQTEAFQGLSSLETL